SKRDWSSDVCSSDLGGPGEDVLDRGVAQLLPRRVGGEQASLVGGSLGALRGDVEATGLDDQGRSVVESHMAVSLVVVHVGTDVGSLDLDSVQGVPPRPVAGQVCRLHGAGGG